MDTYLRLSEEQTALEAKPRVNTNLVRYLQPPGSVNPRTAVSSEDLMDMSQDGLGGTDFP